MQNAMVDQARLRNALLADALVETVADLRLIEAGDLVAYIRGGQWANIADLLQSSSELSFAEGSLCFGCAGDFRIGWDDPISVSLDMEFLAPLVSVFFTVTLGADESLVDIKHVWFADTPFSEVAGTMILARALDEARLPSRSVSLGRRGDL